MLRKVSKTMDIPFELLLTANPSMQQLKKCLSEGCCYVLTENSDIIGNFIIKSSLDSLEITNIAVVESKQNQGVGKYLVDAIFAKLLSKGVIGR